MDQVFVFVPGADDSAAELSAAAAALFPGAAPTALVAGHGEALAAAARDAARAFPQVWSFDAPDLAHPDAERLRPLLAKVLPAGACLLLPHGTLAMDLAPGLSVRLGAAYAPDVVGAEGADGSWLRLVRQEFGGQVHARVACDAAQGAVITVRSGAFVPAPAGPCGTVVDRSADIPAVQPRRRFREVVAAPAGDVDIAREEVLVSVGRGIGDQENIALAEELAEAMGAALSCSRPIVDAKWLDKGRQVGTSGQTVRPKVYLALGISGSFQHLGGIKGSPFLVAVNKNPKAPIFQAASVGVVADLLELLPELTDAVRKVK